MIRAAASTQPLGTSTHTNDERREFRKKSSKSLSVRRYTLSRLGKAARVASLLVFNGRSCGFEFCREYIHGSSAITTPSSKLGHCYDDIAWWTVLSLYLHNIHSHRECVFLLRVCVKKENSRIPTKHTFLLYTQHPDVWSVLLILISDRPEFVCLQLTPGNDPTDSDTTYLENETGLLPV